MSKKKLWTVKLELEVLTHGKKPLSTDEVWGIIADALHEDKRVMSVSSTHKGYEVDW